MINSTPINIDTLNNDAALFESIIAPNLSCRLGNEDKFIKLSLSVGSSGRVEGMCIRQAGYEQYTPYFAILRLILLGQDLSYAYKLNWPELQNLVEGADQVPFFPLPLYLLKKLADDYLGKPKSFLALKNAASDEVICHCFGVLEKDIAEKVENNSADYNFTALQADLLISSGCGTCLDKARACYTTWQNNIHKPVKLYHDHSLAYWSLYLQEKFESLGYDAQVIGPKDDKIEIKLNDDSLKEDIEKLLPGPFLIFLH